MTLLDVRPILEAWRDGGTWAALAARLGLPASAIHRARRVGLTAPTLADWTARYQGAPVLPHRRGVPVTTGRSLVHGGERVTVTLSADEHQRARELAAERGVSVAEVLRGALQEK